MKNTLLSFCLGLFSVIASAQSSIVITLNKTDFCIGDSVIITVSFSRPSNVSFTEFSGFDGVLVSGNSTYKTSPATGTLKIVIIPDLAESKQFHITVTDSAGTVRHVSPYQKNYVVHEYPKAYFVTLKEREQCENKGIYSNFYSYEDSSSADAGSSLASREWDFGDGATATGTAVSHIYNTPGYYYIIMTVTTNHGCIGIYSEYANIHYVPVAKPFLHGELTQCRSANQFLFVDSSFFIQPGVTDSIFVKWTFGNGDSSLSGNVSQHYKTEGDFPVQFIAYTGPYCADSSSFGLVHVKPSPETKAISGDTVSIAGSTETYSVQDSIGAVFNWTVSGGTRISMGSGNSIQVKWNGSPPYTVMVREMGSNGCEGDSSLISVTVNPNGLDELKPGALLLYPNPVKDKLSLINKGKKASVFIYDSYGRIIHHFPLGAGEQKEMGMSGLAAGVYFVKMESGEGSEVRKVLVR